MNFKFPNVHPDAKVGIDFQRTLRILDDEKQYNLPPGLGRFPSKKVNDFPKDRIPDNWKNHNGIVIPMYQSEAMWINFLPHYIRKRNSAYPFAIKVTTGNVSALTGNPYVKELSPGNYLVIPEQPWLDGFVVDEGFIRQFIASPLGSGVSVEQQMTGEDKIGGLQLEIIPMKAEAFDKRFPKLKQEYIIQSYRKSIIRSFTKISSNSSESELLSREMSLATGGKMKQQVFKDPYKIDDWDINNSIQCFIYIVNSIVWKELTGEDPPSVPLTADDYNAKGLPWFDYYQEKPIIKVESKMRDIKSIKDISSGK